MSGLGFQFAQCFASVFARGMNVGAGVVASNTPSPGAFQWAPFWTSIQCVLFRITLMNANHDNDPLDAVIQGLLSDLSPKVPDSGILPQKHSCAMGKEVHWRKIFCCHSISILGYGRKGCSGGLANHLCMFVSFDGGVQSCSRRSGGRPNFNHHVTYLSESSSESFKTEALIPRIALSRAVTRLPGAALCGAEPRAVWRPV